MEKAYLVLANGKIFEGQRFGATDDVLGELVFTTSTVGYIETLTDPTYAGQIIMQTFPLIGNYGIIESDFESENCFAAGYVVRDYCDKPSNFRCEKTLDEFMKQRGIVGLCGVDTRELTKIIRENGTMSAKIVTNFTGETINEIKEAHYDNLVNMVSRKENTFFAAKDKEEYKVAIVDCGVKNSQIENLNKYGISATLVHWDVTAEELLKMNVDGVVISNGPGNPNEYTSIIETIKGIVGKLPVFGIGLGHQLLALAMGGQVEKLPYGHRGSNQPVRDIKNGKVYMTNQNHGYTVEVESLLGKGGELRYVNINDNTCEGIDYPEYKAFSVQFHPVCDYGLRDTEENPYIRFAKLMGGAK